MASSDDEGEIAALFARSLATEDLAEGKRAFAERRTPNFGDR